MSTSSIQYFSKDAWLVYLTLSHSTQNSLVLTANSPDIAVGQTRHTLGLSENYQLSWDMRILLLDFLFDFQE